MKKLIILLVLSVSFLDSVYAQFQSMIEDPVYGPVKKVFIINQQNRSLYLEKLIDMTVVEFDSVGRAIVYAKFFNDKLIAGRFYLHLGDSICLEREVDIENDLVVEGTYRKIYFDHKGREICSFKYVNDSLYRVDSIVYDDKGKMIEKYVSPYMKRELQLAYEYAYDSLGRLIMEKDVSLNKGYTITYSSNGDYQKRFFDKKKKLHLEKCSVNSKGQLIRRKGKDIEEIYSGYDQYGNWTKVVTNINTHSSHGWVKATTERFIVYYETTY